MKDIYIKNHQEYIKKTDNNIIKKYFGKFNFFHDCYIKKWQYDSNKSELKYKIVSDNYFSKSKKYLEFDLYFMNIFEIKFKKEFYVEKKFFSEINWDTFFQEKNDFSFLYCLFDDSAYNEMLNNYFKKDIYKARLFFDNYLNIELDFCDLLVKEPKFINKLSHLEFYELIEKSDYNN